jgi:hypothetical protein
LMKIKEQPQTIPKAIYVGIQEFLFIARRYRCESCRGGEKCPLKTQQALYCPLFTSSCIPKGTWDWRL